MNGALPGLITSCLLLAGCGLVDAGSPRPASTPTPVQPTPAPAQSTPAPAPAQPPVEAPAPTVTSSHGSHPGPGTWPGAFLIRYGDAELSLAPFTYCYSTDHSGSCVDGFDDNPPSIGSPDEVLVFVPVPEFDELVVNQSSSQGECSIDADAERIGDGWWRVSPRGEAGEYRVSFFASGGGSGDMVADVFWQTPSDQGGSCA